MCLCVPEKYTAGQSEVNINEPKVRGGVPNRLTAFVSNQQPHLAGNLLITSKHFQNGKADFVGCCLTFSSGYESCLCSAMLQIWDPEPNPAATSLSNITLFQVLSPAPNFFTILFLIMQKQCSLQNLHLKIYCHHRFQHAGLFSE